VGNCMRWEECRMVRKVRVRDGKGEGEREVDWLVADGMRDLGGFEGLEVLEVVGCEGRNKANARGMKRKQDEGRLAVYMMRLKSWLLHDEGARRAAFEKRNIGHGPMPKLVCVDGKGGCERHAWFREWNEWTDRAKGKPRPSWMSMFTETWKDVMDDL